MPAQLIGMAWWAGFGQTNVIGPSDLYVRATVQAASNAVTLQNTVAAGDLLVAFVVSSGAMTPPAGWTSITPQGNTNPPGAMGAWYKTAVGGDAGATVTWTTPGGPAIIVVDIASVTGATISVDVTSTINYTAAQSTVTMPSITTMAGADLVLTVGLQPGGDNITPAGSILGQINNNWYVSSYLAPAAGVAPTQTWTGANAVWGLLQVAFTSNAGLMPLQVGDLMVANVLTVPNALTPPGWTLLGRYGNPQPGFGGGVYGQVFYKFAAAADLTTGIYQLAAPGVYNFIAITAWRGISQSSPILSFQGANGSGTTATAPAASGLVVGTPVIWLGNQDDAASGGFTIVPVTAQPSTKIYRDWWRPESPSNAGNNLGASASVAASYVITAGTSTAAQTFTLNSSYNWGAATIALNPLGDVPTTPTSSMATLLRVISAGSHVRYETVLGRFGSSPPPGPPPPPFTPTTGVGEPGPRKAILYSLDRQVFEPLQLFPNSVRSAVVETTQVGVKWKDLPNPWSTYTATWESFFSAQQVGVFIGVDDGTQATWNDLPNAWSTYLQAWNAFPAGGNVDVFSDNSTTDNGLAIPYTMVPALLYENSRQDVLLDSWSFYFKIASFFELVTIEFDSVSFPLAPPIPITATFSDLSDETTFGVPKAYPGPGQSKYARYIKVTFSGNSFYRSFAFGGGTLFVQVQERPSKKATI